MTESQFNDLNSSSNLPLVNDGDPRAESIDRIDKSGLFNSVREFYDYTDASAYTEDKKYLFKGGIRHFGSKGEFDIAVYFWERI